MEEGKVIKSRAKYVWIDSFDKENYHRNLFHALDYVRPGCPVFKIVNGKRKLICIATEDLINRFVTDYESHNNLSRQERIKLTNEWAKKYIESSTDWMFDL